MFRNPLGRFLGLATICLSLTAAAVAQEKPKSDKDTKKETPTKPDTKGDAKHDSKTDTKAPMTAEVGKPAPNFELKGTDGKTYKLADLKDKTVVLEWINRDCPVCKAQAPDMKKTAATFTAKGVVWLAIDSTAAHALADNTEHVKKDGMTYPILDDSAGTVGHAYGAKATPTMYVIQKGTLAYSGALVPKGDNTRNYVTEAVEALLAGKDVPTKTTEAYGCSVKYKAAANP